MTEKGKKKQQNVLYTNSLMKNTPREKKLASKLRKIVS